ncbi:hypothetical protein LIP24_09755 [Collinsella aerofaciens]|uniref:hypothetical protein n=1 Tax=Collinsella aerofaciens TaxID=74426 RepID=UPI001D0166C6|nr:hypothetical protein [Collinsella aerofaciens]MCB5366921.1 hypothetical protein [Collinsella aerofaciens]
MKLLADIEPNNVYLEVLTTGKEIKTFVLPAKNIHYWYPFNINFSYRYTEAKGFLYLVKEKSYEGKNYYNVDILKRTKALSKRDGVPFNPDVFKRNMYIIEKAKNIGLPTIIDDFTMEDVKEGFKTLSDTIVAVRDRIESRYIEKNGEPMYTQSIFSEEWDELVYSQMTEEEEEALIELGEMYCMLTVMRKLAYGKQLI